MFNGPSDSGATGTSRVLDRFLAAAGVLAAGRLVYHMVDHFSALYGVQHWLDAHRSLSMSQRGWAAPFVIYGLLGAVRVVTTPSLWKTAGYFVGSGVVAVAYGLVHVVQLYAVSQGPGSSTRAVYEILWVHAGQWPWLLTHVLGLCAVSLHVAIGVPRATSVLLGYRGEAARFVGVAVGIALLLFQVQLLSYFALGRPVVSMSLPTHEENGTSAAKSF